MDIREHSITLVSVIVGLGLTELLANVNRLVRTRHHVRWYGVPLIWAAVCLILVVNLWWGVYLGAIGLANPSSAAVFLAYLASPVMLYLVCSAAVPHATDGQGLDLRATYFDGSRYFTTLLIGYIAITLAQVYLATGREQWDGLNYAMRLGLIAILVPLIWTRRPWYHWFAATFMLVVLSLRMFTQTLH